MGEWNNSPEERHIRSYAHTASAGMERDRPRPEHRRRPIQLQSAPSPQEIRYRLATTNHAPGVPTPFSPGPSVSNRPRLAPLEVTDCRPSFVAVTAGEPMTIGD